MADLSRLRQQLRRVQQEREKVLDRLMDSQPFLAAQVYERYKTCGHPQCKCQKGELHGPFVWIYQHKKEQKVLSTTVDEAHVSEAMKLASRYKSWAQQRQKVREWDQKIQQYLHDMEAILERDVQIYVTKRSRGRPKKEGEIRHGQSKPVHPGIQGSPETSD